MKIFSHRFLRRVTKVVPTLFVLIATTQCAPTQGEQIDLHGKNVHLTIIHTSDIHSRLLPYQYTPLLPDKNAGMEEGKGPYGGVARMAYVAKRERARADRSIHIDGGDVMQGAPIFNYFNGEAEIRSLSMMGIDAMVIANHEFDRGALNVYLQLQQWATFPILAANYLTEDSAFPGNQPLGSVLKPYTILNARGLRVGVIGMGNLSTITSLFEMPNRLGLTPLNTRQIAQFYVDLLRPQVDLIVVVTHLGLEVDEQMIQETEGIDVVLGGHNHIVVSPPKGVFDCGGNDTDTSKWFVSVPSAVGHGDETKRFCKPRRVLLLHSGAFAKFVGRLDLELSDNKTEVEKFYGKKDYYDPVNGFEVLDHRQKVVPIDNDVAEDRSVAQLLEPYKQSLKNVGNLDILVGYAPVDVRRVAPNGGDSELGNLIATAMWLRLGVQTDFSLTNTQGIRADLPKGPITIEQMFNVFPFDNTITKMQLSGAEVYEMFDFVARRAASRACTSQVQIAGSFVVFNCTTCNTKYRPDHPANEACAEHVFVGYQDRACGDGANTCTEDEELDAFMCDKTVKRCRTPISLSASYELATSNYLAGGGSGFRVLKRNTTQFDTKIQQRDAVTDFVRIGYPCGWQKSGDSSGLVACSTDSECKAFGDMVCACPQAAGAIINEKNNTFTCSSTTQCDRSVGRCVLEDCRNDVAAFWDRNECTGSDKQTQCRNDACRRSGEQCKILACLDRNVGAKVDGRQIMVGR